MVNTTTFTIRVWVTSEKEGFMNEVTYTKLEDFDDIIQPDGLMGQSWAIVVYPESLPDNWKDYLIQIGLRCVISPLHDRDTWTSKDEKKNPDHVAGSLKKAHYHVILCWDNRTTWNHVLSVIKYLNVSYALRLSSAYGMYRYFWHLDHPEKFQYDTKTDIATFLNGITARDLIHLSKGKQDALKHDLIIVIEKFKFRTYFDFIKYSGFMGGEYESVAMNNTILFRELINSLNRMRSVNDD